MPQKEGLKVPTELEIINTMRAIKSKELFQYDEELAKRQLIEFEPASGSTKNEKAIKDIDATELILSNGARVVFKQTDYKQDEILMLAVSPGGNSLATDKEFNSIRSASAIIENSGVGSFSSVDLRRYLYGKRISLSPYIENLYSGFRSQCLPFDFEEMMKLIYLYFTAPRKDETAFQNYKEKLDAILTNQSRLPEFALKDSVETLLYDHNPRKTGITKNNLQELDLEKSFSFYKDRFTNASNYTFFFVGTFTKADIKMFVEKYIASLPSTGKKENWKDDKIVSRQGIEKKIYVGNNPNSITKIVYSGNFKYSLQNCMELKPYRTY